MSARARVVAGAVRRQAVWLLAACGAGAVALLFGYVEDWSEELQRRAAAVSPFLPALIVAVAMVLILRLRDTLFPGTEGTGIPQAIAALKMGEGPERQRVLSLRIALGKTILLGIGLLAGATIGREGPSVHVAACFLYLSKRIADFPRHFVERGLVLAGGAAGIAAAFNTPLAAIIFAFEEIGRSFEKENAGLIVRTVVVACLVCWIPLSDYLFYGRVEARLVSVTDWLLVPTLGLIGGVLGGLFARAVVAASIRVRRGVRRRPYTVAAALGLALAILGLASDGQSYGGGFTQAQAILISGRDLPPWYPIAKAAASFVSLVSGIPGGLFDPSLSVGAALGQLVHSVLPGSERQAVVLLAMGGYFSGVVQSPITAAVILVEMTSAEHLLLPLLATTVLAYEASRRVCPTAIYEALSATFVARRDPAA